MFVARDSASGGWCVQRAGTSAGSYRNLVTNSSYQKQTILMVFDQIIEKAPN